MPKRDELPKIERNPIPVGRHILRLREVKEHEGPNTYQPMVQNEDTGEMEYPMRREWIWQFESETIDPATKRPYEYAVWTPRYYSARSDKNKLTLLMRHLAPDNADEERETMIDTDALIGKRWTARLVKATSKNGKEYVTHNSFEPIEDRFDPEASAKQTGHESEIPF